MNCFFFVSLIIISPLVLASSAFADARQCLNLFQEPKVILSLPAGLQKPIPWNADTTPAKNLFSHRLIQEFSIRSKDLPQIPDLFSMLIFQPDQISKGQFQALHDFLGRGHIENAWIEKTAESVLDRPVSIYQETALRLARVLDRDIFFLEPSLRPSEEMFLAAKKRLLYLADFPQKEQDLLFASGIMSDEKFYELRYSFADQAHDVKSELVMARNKDIISSSQSWKNENPTAPDRKLALNFEEANALLSDVTNNNIAKYDSRLKYDPQGSLGFCFGRALTAHLLAMKRGVDKNSIRKVFVSGTMNTPDGITWSFHVATLIAKKGGGFWVIDPNFLEVQTLENWFATYEKQSPDQRIRIFITPAARFGSEGFGMYSNQKYGLTDAFYNNYFIDLFKDFKLQDMIFKNRPRP